MSKTVSNKQISQSAAQARKQAIIGWSIVLIGGIFYSYQFLVRVSPNIMGDELMTNLTIDAAALGAVIGVYYWGYALMQIPLGITMDRLGPRYFLCGASLLLALSCYIFGNTNNTTVAQIARFLMGSASACGLIGTIKLGTIWLKPHHIAKVSSITILLGTVGAGLGGSPLNIYLNTHGIQQTMQLLAFIGVAISVIIYLSLRAHPQVNHHNEIPDVYANQHPLVDLKQIIKTGQIWILAIYGMLMYIPITIIGIGWGVSFVERVCETSETVSASVVSTMFLGAALGSPFFALVSDYFKSRRSPMLLGSIITACIWYAILSIDGIPLQSMYILFFIAGFAYTAKCLTFASICEIMPAKMSGTSIAFVNMIVMTTGIVFHPLIGQLLILHWDGTFKDSIPYYSLTDFRFALMVIPVCLAVSAFILILVRESHPESDRLKHYKRMIDTEVL